MAETSPRLLSHAEFPRETAEEQAERAARAREVMEAEKAGAPGYDAPHEGLDRELKRIPAQPEPVAPAVKEAPIAKEASAPAAPKIPTWAQITSSPKYQALDNAGKESVRMDYWRNYVSVHIDTDKLDQARKEFDDFTKPTVVRRAVDALRSLASSPRQEERPGTIVGEEARVPADGVVEEQQAGADDGEFTKGVKAGYKGAHQIGAAAALVPVLTGISNYSQQLERFDAVDRGELVAPPPGSRYTGAAHADPFLAEAVRYQNITNPEQRAEMRQTALSRIAGLRETQQGLVDTWRIYGEEMKQHKGKVPDFTDVKDVQGFMDWLQFNMGQGIPYITASALSGVLGFVLGGPAGAVGGLALTGGGMGAGDIMSEQLERAEAVRMDPKRDIHAMAPEVDPKKAVAGAVPYAALEFLGPAGRAVRIAYRGSKEGLEQVAESYFKRAGKEIPKNAVEEFLNEAGQEIVKDWTVAEQGEPVLTEENLKKWFNAGMAGAAAGAPFGAATAAQQRGQAQPAQAQQQPGAQQPEAATAPGSEAIDAAALRGREQDIDGRVEPTMEEQPHAAASGITPVLTGEKSQPADVPAKTGEQQPEKPAADTPGGVTEPPPPRGDRRQGAQAAGPEQDQEVGGKRITTVIQPSDAPPSELKPIADGLKKVFESPVDEKAHEAATSPTNDRPEPTEPQKDAGNYRKGHVHIGGLDISIENPSGSTRSGVGADGKPWSVTMKDHYGYIRGSVGKDKDHVDAFIKAGTPLELSGGEKVFIIDQKKPGNGHFDEHKVMIGYGSSDEAEAAYKAHYSKDWDGIRDIVEMDLVGFKQWLREGDTKAPAAQTLPEGDREILSLPMLGRGPGWRGVNSADIELQRYRNGKWGFGLGLETNVTGMRGGPHWSAARYDTRDEALAAAVERALEWTAKDRPAASEQSNQAHPKHIAYIRKWLESLKPGGSSAPETGKQQRGGEREHPGDAGGREARGREDRQRQAEKPEPRPADSGRGGDEKGGPAPQEEGAEAAPSGGLTGEQVAEAATQVAMRFASGAGFDSISEARAYIGEKIRVPVKAGTIAAKQVDEAIEAGIVRAARTIVKKMRERGATDKEIYAALRELYGRQPNLNVRTSTSIEQQAYSTPVPLAFIASRLAGITAKTRVLEPTAGNGVLLIEADPDQAVANELNDDRAAALRAQGFITSQIDATALPTMEPVDAVIANPPFGYVKGRDGRNREWKIDERYTTNQVDHAIAFKALEAMKDDGRVVLIVGAPREGKADGYEGVAKRSFYYTLYRDYNVVDHFTVSGDLYAKQGAAWPVDVIVIAGRGKSALRLPQAVQPRVYGSWDELAEKLDVRAGQDRSEGAGAAPHGEGAGGRAAAVRGEPARGSRPQPTPVEPGAAPGGARPDRVEPAPAGLDAGARGERGKPARGRGLPGSDRPADAGVQPDRVDVAKVVDEEFAAIFGDLEKAPPRTVGEAAASAVTETAAGLEKVAKGLDELFGTKGKLGAGPSFDEETYAKAKPFFIEGVKHFKAAASDIRELVRLLLTELRTKFAMTVEAIHRMKPYIVRFVEEVQAGVIQIWETRLKPGSRPQEAETEHQKAYTPKSAANSIGSLVPANMQGSIQESLEQLEQRVGNLDEFVAKELGYQVGQLPGYFSAEQVDALALALDSMKRGSGFIIGDQTGIGKGRVNAGIIRWAMKNQKVPIFVTEKPNLYGDIMRDLADIGMSDVTPLITNNDSNVPLDDEAALYFAEHEVKVEEARTTGQKAPRMPRVEERPGKWLKTTRQEKLLRELMAAGGLGDYDAIFTTYNQMQTVEGGKFLARHDFMREFADGAIVLFDESHNAGGTEKPDADAGKPRPKEKEKPKRSDFARGLLGKASSVFYSSATYAKRPSVMDLYFRTDMALAVDNISQLVDAIKDGGVPLQQVVAAMLAKAGQYIRREKSFAGIDYDTAVVKVNHPVAEKISSIMKMITEFDHAKAKAVEAIDSSIKDHAGTITEDGSIGQAGAHSTNFTSLMHNIVNQMLLALKVAEIGDEVIASLKRGEKPVLTVANTMGSFIEDYVTDFNLNPGDAIDISFQDLLHRYLERSRDIVEGDPYGKKTRKRLSDEELGPAAAQMWKDIEKLIRGATVLREIPLSPIDHIKARIEKEGYKFGEITGRAHMVDYSAAEATGKPIYRRRSGSQISIGGRKASVAQFNNGMIDVLLVNQAGATGLSLHSSEKVKDQRRRHMVIIQAEGNIDIHMQVLGRINRTGQVTKDGKAPKDKPAAFGLPRYTQLVADVPSEKRPAAVLAKKMASLNANTTASRGSAVTAKNVVDFMNEYGDEVAAQLMEDNPEWHRRLDDPLHHDDKGEGFKREGAIRKVTGRIPLLPLKLQEELYDLLESEYQALVDEKDRMGENVLEAKTLDLQARTLKTIPVFEAKGGDSPFAAGAVAEVSEVKKLGKAYTSEELIALLQKELGFGNEIGPKLHHAQMLGHKRAMATAEALEAEFAPFLAEELAHARDTARGPLETKLNQMHDRLMRAIEFARVGRIVSLKTKYGSVPAVVLKVERKGKPKNPAALGSWKFTFAIADAVRHITIPGTRLFTEGFAPDTSIDMGGVQVGNYTRPKEFDGKPLLAEFDEAQSQSHEHRVIITGNLLAGFRKFHSGRIMNFTTEDGQVRQGILMPAKFDIDKALNEAPVQFEKAEDAIAFLELMTRQGKPAVLTSEQEKLYRVAQIGYGPEFRVSIAAAKDTGGVLYLSRSVREAAGQDFVKAAQVMRADLPRARAVRTLQTIIDLGYNVETTAHREDAKNFLKSRGNKDLPLTRREFLAGAAGALVNIASGAEASARTPMKVGDHSTASEVILRLAETSPSADYRSIAKQILPLMHGINVRVVTPGKVYPEGIPGLLQIANGVTSRRGADGKITLWLRSDIGLTEPTVLHEGIHGATMNELDRQRALPIARRSEAYNRLSWLMSQVRTATRAMKLNEQEAQFVKNATQNLDEFVAWGLTDDTFQSVLRRIRVAGQNVWEGFIDAILRLIGVRPASAARSALEELFEAGRMLIEDAKKTPDLRADLGGKTLAQLSPAGSMARDTSLTDKVLSAPFKLARWDRMAQSAWAKLSELNERITDRSEIYETVRAGVESDYGLEEPYIDRRVEMQVNLQKWARGAVTMLDKLGALTRDESRVAYEWMNERDADELIEDLPDQSKQTLRELKELIRSLGEEAVALGHLSREVFERNELAYLHRSYLRHELEQTIMARLGNRKAIALWAEQYKGRGLKDWRTIEQLNGWAGERLDPRTMKGKKFHRLELRARVSEDVTGRMEAIGGRQVLGRLRKVVYVPDGKPIPKDYAAWHDDGLWEVRWLHGGKYGLWRDLTKDERIALGEIDEVRFAVAKTLHLMTHDIEVGRMQKWIADTYAKRKLDPGDKEVTAHESMAAAFGRKTWVRVPSTEISKSNVRKYGPLAGLYVPGPIWNDIRQRVAIGDRPGAIRKLWDDALRLWKISKTALSPGVHTNNVMANFFIADFHDLRAKDLVKALRVMLDAKLSKQPDQANADLYRRFEDSGALHGMFKYHELKREALDPLLEDIRREALNNEELAMTRVLSVISWLNAMERTAKKGANAMIDAYGAEDEIFRLAMFIKGVRHGVSDLEAGKLARKAFLDYDINAPWIQALRRTVFPFIAFPYRAIPMMIDTFTNKPWKLIKYVGVAWGLNMLAYAMLGAGADDEERERRLMPEEKAGRIWGLFPKMMRMPWNSDDGNPVFLDVRRWFPAGDIFDVGGTHAALPWSPTALPGGPIALLAELFANKSQFTGQDITQTTDTGLEVAKKVGLHLYRFAMPNLFMIPGTWSFEGLRGAVGLSEAGRVTDVFGREMSLPQAFGSALGVKLGTYPEDVMRYNLMRKMNREVNEILGNIYKASGDLQRNRMSEEQFREYTREQMEKVKRLQEETRAKVQPSARP